MKHLSIGLLALCEVAAMALWFSASAVVPSIVIEFPLTPSQVSLFTSMVQLGFVAGTLASAALGLADLLDPRHDSLDAAERPEHGMGDEPELAGERGGLTPAVEP